MANLPVIEMQDIDLSKGGFYVQLNDMVSFLQGAIGENGTEAGVKIHLGLDSIDNTSDASKPISDATLTALNAKHPTLVSGVNLKTIMGQSLLGSENISIETIPSGVITMWSGIVSAIPNGWYLCDGTNNTPDLRGRFVYGASVDADVGVTGGSADAVNVAHTHSGSTNTTGSHAHNSDTTLSYNLSSYRIAPQKVNINGNYSASATSSSGSHSHTVTVNSSGVSGTNLNLPPYMKLAYIQKG